MNGPDRAGPDQRRGGPGWAVFFRPVQGSNDDGEAECWKNTD